MYEESQRHAIILPIVRIRFSRNDQALLPLSWYIRFAEGDSSNPATVMSALYITEHTLAVIGVILTLLGLVGLYTRQIRESGRMGLLGFLSLFTSRPWFL